MHILQKAALGAALATASLSAHAAETHITVWADVDPTLALLQADGSVLPDSVALTHNPTSGLVPWERMVRIYSNDEDADVEVRLLSAPSLVHQDGTGAAVPMQVLLNRRVLGTVAEDFLAGDLFDGAMPGASVAMPLTIKQTTQTPITAKGRYTGLVSIAMVQKAGAP
ncbi:CS1 type fimbrial major subunit [Stenotrophomonas sp. YAU14D1_LEIMI4_1]|uniref:CS1 type fimbrial major subunit n=1 Tax=Stenotrophomonas sp. YAU14D1_LEIMI4_1 TaxID=2072407 RepID=UPI000D54102B|nr:CS1 type fimbrial major subunit [Stenotrophomonas sp. YAU14D1_LEIMI4_1]AWH26439.1 fimbrial protein [Stenotrophomonas sp. YAU14D1_LEIMI4_1]